MQARRETYRAMQLDGPGQPLRAVERDMPVPGPNEILLQILACGVCRTDLHIADGEIAEARYPVIPGHEIVGRIVEMGADVSGFAVGQRIGVPCWVPAAAIVAIVWPAGKISVTIPNLPAVPGMADMPAMSSRAPNIALPSRSAFPMRKPRHCCAQA